MAVVEMEEHAGPIVMWSRDLIGRQVTHLSRLVNDLRDVSRLTSEKIALERQVLNIRAIVNHAMEGCESQTMWRSPALTISMPDHVVAVRGDTTRLMQVITNVFNTAIKYTRLVVSWTSN